jgi:hypothetical protein
VRRTQQSDNLLATGFFAYLNVHHPLCYPSYLHHSLLPALWVECRYLLACALQTAQCEPTKTAELIDSHLQYLFLRACAQRPAWFAISEHFISLPPLASHLIVTTVTAPPPLHHQARQLNRKCARPHGP